jgi:glycosyltransferase involved in cell wall biosynthesis
MPFISVIVTAYRRRQYLYNALLSVKAQTLPKDRYEVVVVKDFEDPQVDGLIKEMGWRSVHSDEEYQGRMYLNGLKEADGDVIAFLDDDDVYEPSKLEYVHNVFSRSPDVGYLQHSYRLVDTNYRDIPMFEREAPRNLVPRDELKLTWDEVSKYRWYGHPDPMFYIFRSYRLYPDRNSTSIAIKRELLDRHKDLLNVLVYEIDNFLFASAIADKVPMFFSDARLSLWTFHGGNFVSRLQLRNGSPEEVERLIRLHYNHYQSYDAIGRRLLSFYPNYYACYTERHKLLYLDLARRFGKPTAGLTLDRSAMLWCCVAGLCFNEFTRYFLAPIRL